MPPEWVRGHRRSVAYCVVCPRFEVEGSNYPRGRIDQRPGGPGQELQPLRDAAFVASADFLLAAWFLWMTPLETALSS